MPLVALAPASADARTSLATAKWNAILLTHPDLAPAVELQRELITLVIALAQATEHGHLPRLSLPPRYVAAKLAKGIPALFAEPIPVSSTEVRPTFLGLCDALARGGAGDAARNIQTAIEDGSFELGSLLRASLTRDHKAMQAGAVQRGVAPDLLWLLAELAVSPFVHGLQRLLTDPMGRAARDEPLRSALDTWRQGYCPICGSWPALVERLQGTRVMRCSFCALAWSLEDAGCYYCGQGAPSFAVSTPDPARTDRGLETCDACHNYVKAIDVSDLAPFPLIAIADLETMDMDVVAMQRGYHRPHIKAFGAAE
jgi:FdhE protein